MVVEPLGVNLFMVVMPLDPLSWWGSSQGVDLAWAKWRLLGCKTPAKKPAQRSVRDSGHAGHLSVTHSLLLQ